MGRRAGRRAGAVGEGSPAGMEPGLLHWGVWIPTFVGMTVSALVWLWIPVVVGMMVMMEPGLLYSGAVLDSHFRGNDGGDGGLTV